MIQACIDALEKMCLSAGIPDTHIKAKLSKYKLKEDDVSTCLTDVVKIAESYDNLCQTSHANYVACCVIQTTHVISW